MTAQPRARSGPTGYTLVLPPGWVQVPVDGRADAAVRGLVAEAMEDPPRDVPPDTLATLRRRLEGQLLAAVRSARHNGGSELYLPVAPVGGVIMPASFVVGEVELEAAEPGAGDVVAAVLARLLAEDERAQPVELDRSPALRTERALPARPDASMGVEAAARAIDYLAAVPGRPGRWLAVSFTALVVEDGDLTDLLVELFDAVLTTFRWEVAA